MKIFEFGVKKGDFFEKIVVVVMIIIFSYCRYRLIVAILICGGLYELTGRYGIIGICGKSPILF